MRPVIYAVSLVACTEVGDSRLVQDDTMLATETIDALTESSESSETTVLDVALETEIVATETIDTTDAQPEAEVTPEVEVAPEVGPTCTATYCADFEGGMPAGVTTVSPNCSGNGRITIDTTIGHTGTQSMRVDGGGGYCDHVFAELPLTATGSVWLRFWVRMGSALEDGHVTFLTMRDTTDNNKDLRMGGQSRIFMWNRESDDATLPELSPTGIAASTAPTPNAWTCVEAHLDGGKLETYVAGDLVAGLVIDGSATPDIDRRWIESRPSWSPVVDTLRLGWEAYGGKTMTLWFDDVAIDDDRIPCGP